MYVIHESAIMKVRITNVIQFKRITEVSYSHNVTQSSKVRQVICRQGTWLLVFVG